VIGEDDLIVNAYGKPGSGFLDSIRLSHLKRELNLPFSPQSGTFPADLELSTFARILQLASQLAAEGREGKPVGTLFVVGDQAGVYPYTRQMIVNPFHGYADSDKNILDPGIEETVKEYAKIDGAFIIRGDGTILSAGTFLSGQPTADEMQSGLGARHAAAQGITAVSKALAIAISESTRKVTVFQSGRRVMEL
jgi:DNA integrity scanning protein DisA with diadenylate cyclase activity